MATRTYTSVVTPDTIALNALIFGYAGHSLVTPHAPLQQLWWTDERIQETVTREFVISRLRPNERNMLLRPLAFGDGLTDDTYLDWIMEKAKRFFLVLAECGVSDQIFGVIDDSWDDDDLPIPRDTIERLALAYENDETLNNKFYTTQFQFLLRELRQGLHINYAKNEHVPMEDVHRLPPSTTLQRWPRVHRPKRPDEVFVRRGFKLGEEDDTENVTETEFHADIEAALALPHEHIAPVWATYSAKGFGYILSPFVGEHTLISFIEHRTPPQYQRLPKCDRQALLVTWMHCLASTVAYLHRNGCSHTAIRPSNIIIDSQNNISFSDIGSIRTFQADKKQNVEEVYNYGAPESHIDSHTPSSENSPVEPPSTPSTSSSARSRSLSRFGKRSSNGSKSSSSDSISSTDSGKSRSWKEAAIENTSSTEKADIFSLACVFLDILTFLLKLKQVDFIKHRSSKIRDYSSKNTKTMRVDSSFHYNVAKLFSWMNSIEDAALAEKDPIFLGIPHLLRLIRTMLSPNPTLRPSASAVCTRLYEIMAGCCGIDRFHC
ncbi:kinase-like protein, partial [Aulographum hederae CBS 113979]